MSKIFVHEDLKRLTLAFNARDKVWTFILVQRRMRPGKPVVVSTAQLAKLGVNRTAKWRALRGLERDGFIRVQCANGQNPRAELLK
jgi:DNA-binding transcriptional regulator YhcF (GntR family)